MIYLKTSLFAGLLWLTATVTSAQFTTGSRFIGGGFGISTPVAPKLASSINVSLQPEFGYFRSPNVAVGFTATLGIEHAKAGNATSNIYSVGVGPFIQRFLPVIPNFGFVLTGRSALDLSYKKSKSTDASGATASDASATGIALDLSGSPGLFYQVNQQWLLLLDLGSYPAFSVSYGADKTTTNTSEVKNSKFGYDIGRTYSLSGSAIRIRYFLR